MRSDFSINLGGLVYIFLFYFVPIVKTFFHRKQFCLSASNLSIALK
jgi:hypothetical protein